MHKTWLFSIFLLLGVLVTGCKRSNPTAADVPLAPSPVLAISAAVTMERLPDTPVPVTPQVQGASPTFSPAPVASPTATRLPWAGYPAPTVTPATPVPPPFPAVQLPPGVQVAVLLGTDSEAPYVGRTDTILLVFFNPDNGSASLVSVPRDLLVYVPGHTMQKINTAYVSGGIDLLFLTLEYNLGVRPQHWALAHLNDFSQFVNDLGGIPVYVPVKVEDPWCFVPAGDLLLDGYTALCYVRSRLGSSDFDRSRRQQDVLLAIFRRFVSLDSLRHLPEWYARYSGTVRTDLSLADLMTYIPLVLRIHGGSVHHFQISWDQVTSWKTPDTGSSVLLPRRDQIARLLQQAVEAILPVVPTSPALEAQIAALTASPTPAQLETPVPTETEMPFPTETETPTPEIEPSPVFDSSETPSPTP